MPAPLAPETYAAIAAVIAAGWNTAKIAAAFGVSKALVRRLRSHPETTPKPPARVPPARHVLARLIRKGHTKPEIAEIVGYSVRQVGVLLHEYGLTMPMGRADRRRRPPMPR